MRGWVKISAVLKLAMAAVVGDRSCAMIGRVSFVVVTQMGVSQGPAKFCFLASPRGFLPVPRTAQLVFAIFDPLTHFPEQCSQ